MSRTVNIPIPIEYAEQVGRALEALAKPCPRHGHDSKVLVAVDACQWQLLQILETVVHGDAQVEFADGRPTQLYLRQSYKFGKDGLEKIGWFAATNSEPPGKIIAFELVKS